MKLIQKQLLSHYTEKEICRNDHEVEYVRLENEILVHSRHPEFELVGNGIDVSIGVSVCGIQELFETLQLTGFSDLKEITPEDLLRAWFDGLAEIHTCMNENLTGLIFRNFMGNLFVKEDAENCNWKSADALAADPYHMLAYTHAYFENHPACNISSPKF